MSESPSVDCRLEVLGISCVGQQREMVNLFCPLMKSTSKSQRIENASDQLRQRYGVSRGFTSKPKVNAIRYRPKVSFNSNLLKLFNEVLNLLEVFAYTHNETAKLSGQLFFNIANHLPNT